MEVTFTNTLDMIVVGAQTLKKLRAGLEDEIAGIEKRRKDEESKLRIAQEDYKKLVSDSTAALREIESKRKESDDYFRKAKIETESMLADVKNKLSLAEKTLQEAEAKDRLASTALSQAEKLKNEYQSKVEKARAMAQALG